MKIYVTTDTHFGHDRLCELSGRPADFGERLLMDISSKTGHMLIHCGDFCIGNDAKHIEAFMKAARGFEKKILVRGNHDHKSYNWYIERGFDQVCEVMQMRLFGKEVLFSHMPFARGDYMPSVYHKPDFHVHGHLHGDASRHASKELYDPDYHKDAAPEIHDYKIVNLQKLLTKPLGRL